MSEHVQTSQTPAETADVIDLTDRTAAPSSVEAATTFAPNPMAIEEVSVAATAVAPTSSSTLDEAPIDAFDAGHHKGILDRLEHELALVDAALAHIDEDELDAAETAIKELARHNDDGQVALPLR